MNVVADRTQPDIIYFGWSENLPFGTSEDGSDGRIHVSKVQIRVNEAPKLLGDVAFDGFVMAGGIDITDDGIIGVLCAKYVPAWVRDYVALHKHEKFVLGMKSSNYPPQMGPMMLAVCEVHSSTMTKNGVPWRIGKQYVNELVTPIENFNDQLSYGHKGNLPFANVFELQSTAYGHLIYSPKHRTWTAWYGATDSGHTGYAMHTYKRDAKKITPKYPVPGNIPDTVVEPREEVRGRWCGPARSGVGDHQIGSAARYHPLIGDIYFQKHIHDPMFMQQYGLEETIGNFQVPPGSDPHRGGRVQMVHEGSEGWHEGSIRPCGESTISAFMADDGHICALISKEGEILKWATIDSRVSPLWFETNADGTKTGFNFIAPRHRLTRLATLGNRESEAKCGSSARFLMGYENEDGKRWLVEIDGTCARVTEPMEVTEHNLWPVMAEWTTTQDGAVVWVSSWNLTEKIDGTYHPDLSKKAEYPPRESTKNVFQQYKDADPYEGKHEFLKSTWATTWATISVYWPSAKMPTKENFPTEPPPPFALEAFGWKLELKQDSWDWNIYEIQFNTVDGIVQVGPGGCAATSSGHWPPTPPGNVFDGHLQSRWWGRGGDPRRCWVGIECSTKLAVLTSVALKTDCGDETRDAVIISGLRDGQWKYLAEVPILCGDLQTIWSASSAA